jgi:prevent-host-death family protein
MAVEIVPLSQARQRLLELAREVDERGKRFLLVRNGVPVSMLIPVEEYEAWQETLDVLGDDETMSSLRRGLSDAKAGRLYRRSRDGRFVRAQRRRTAPGGGHGPR